MASSVVIDKTTLINLYSKQLQELTDVLNTEVKWNFVARYCAQQSMATIDNNRFFQWIKTPDQSFEESSSSPFAAPKKVSACFAKVHQLARNILSSQDKQHDKNLEALVNTFKKQSAQIQCFAPTETIKIADALLGHISRVTRCTLSLNPQEKLLLVNNFNNLFHVTSHQKLMDTEIDLRIQQMFAILEEEPTISSTKLAQHLRFLWNVHDQRSQKLITDLSEFFVVHNPHNKTLQHVLKESIQYNNVQPLIGQWLIYRLPSLPWGMKIENGIICKQEGFANIKLGSAENCSAVLKFNIDTNKIISISFDRSVKKETYSVTDTGETKLDEHLLSLSKRGLATEGAVKKALKERDSCTAEVLAHLIDNQHTSKIKKGFIFINHHPEEALSQELYEAIFAQEPLFHRLCTNRYVKEGYGKEEKELLNPELQHRFGADLLHEAQCLILSGGNPKAQQGNRDLIKNLCEVSQLTESIGREVYAIPFIGSTGSGKSTTVSYMMGVPMEKFEDEFGETRIRHKEAANNTLPKIGFALGLSETLHTKTFSLLPPPPFEPDPNDPFAEPHKHDPEFRGVLMS